MGLITSYITRLVLARFALVLAGLVAFLISLDLMVSAEDVTDKLDGGAFAVLRYATLQVPIVSSGLIKFASLLAGLLTFTTMMRRNEITPIWSMGVSQFGLMVRLAPVALFFAVVQLAVDDRMMPQAAETLRAWDLGDDYGISPDEAAWLYIENDIVRVPFATIGGNRLENITIFQRDPKGNLTSRLDAVAAVYEEGVWRLWDVTLRRVGNETVAREFVREWNAAIDPEGIVRLTVHPKDLSFAELIDIIGSDRRGYWLPHFYVTWLNVKMAAAVAPAMMLFLIVALAQRFQRTGHIELLFFGGLSYGFGFFILNGIGVAMGESGLLPPIIAGWAPVFAFGFVIAAIALWREVYDTPQIETLR
ncbi:MAG: LptF/LptG family permease [Alphaproteobacteria bacterium]|nr:LptF/LptG family permease [Alphaproteobacteria bacterium]MCZ6763454.1 LptF/LptG family permease [Alphaproteobacteria bacterium]